MFLLGSIGVSAALVVGALGFAVPAFAAPASTQASCSGNLTCTYVDRGYSNFLGSRGPGVKLENITAENRNKLSSWINYTTTGSRFYYNVDGRGTCVPMYAQSRASADNSTNPDNDQAESWGFDRSC